MHATGAAVPARQAAARGEKGHDRTVAEAAQAAAGHASHHEGALPGT
jgi:hypothetical protein